MEKTFKPRTLLVEYVPENVWGNVWMGVLNPECCYGPGAHHKGCEHKGSHSLEKLLAWAVSLGEAIVLDLQVDELLTKQQEKQAADRWANTAFGA